MTDSAAKVASQSCSVDELAGSSVYFKMPRRKGTAPFTLKEEVKQMEPVFIEAICGIVGLPNSGRKLLGERFIRNNDGDIEEVSNIQLCYTGNFKMVIHGRLAKASLKAYIIPPPQFTEENKPRYDEASEPLYVRASKEFCCLLFAFDVTNPESFTAAQDCIKNMKISLPSNYFFVGNKCDLRGKDANEVQQDFAKKISLRLGAADYFECSAKKNINVKPLMEAVARCEYNLFRV